MTMPRRLVTRIDERGIDAPIAGEVHRIGEDDAASIVLDEVPRAATAVVVHGTPAGGGNFVEATGAAPGPGQFRVRYSNATLWPGKIDFNVADANIIVTVDYTATGSWSFARDVNRIREYLLSLAVPVTQYGARAAASDNYTAIMEAYNDQPDGGAIVVNGAFAFETPLVLTRRVHVFSVGDGSGLIPHLADTQDAVTFQNQTQLMIQLALYGNTVGCKNGIVLSKVYNSIVHLKPFTAAKEWAAIMKGILCCRDTRVLATANYPTPVPGGMALVGELKLVAVDGIPCNANVLDVQIDVSVAGLRIEDQLAQGNNEIKGIIQGGWGQPFYMENTFGASVHNLHMESNTATVESRLVSCKATKLEGVWNLGAGAAGRLRLSTCTGGRLTDVHSDSIVIDADCAWVEVGQDVQTGFFGGSFTDRSPTTIYRGRRSSVAGGAMPGGRGEADPVNHAINGTMERWGAGDAVLPDRYSFVVAPPAVVHCGDGYADTTRNVSPHSMKVTIADPSHAVAYALPIAVVKGRTITVGISGRSASGQPGDPGPYLNLLVDGAPVNGPGVTLRDAWGDMALTYDVPAGAASVSVVFAPNAVGTCHFADLWWSIGVTMPRTGGGVPTEFMYMGGRIIGHGTAAPVAGNYLVGDIWLNDAPTVAGGAGSQYVVDHWRCTAAGAPGTWVEARTLTGT